MISMQALDIIPFSVALYVTDIYFITQKGKVKKKLALVLSECWQMESPNKKSPPEGTECCVWLMYLAVGCQCRFF